MAFARFRSDRRNRAEARAAKHARNLVALRADMARIDRDITTSKLYTYGPNMR